MCPLPAFRVRAGRSTYARAMTEVEKNLLTGLERVSATGERVKGFQVLP